MYVILKKKKGNSSKQKRAKIVLPMFIKMGHTYPPLVGQNEGIIKQKYLMLK